MACGRNGQPRLAQGEPLDEDASLALLEDYGLQVPKRHVVGSVEQAVTWAQRIGYPVVLKTAASGILHKSDVGGVKLNLRDEAELRAAYDDLAQRLGARMLLTRMVGKGTELALGGVHDPQFGMLLMLGAGGTLIELLDDRAFALAPIDELEAERKLDGLKLRKLLGGVRGAAAGPSAERADGDLALLGDAGGPGGPDRGSGRQPADRRPRRLRGGGRADRAAQAMTHNNNRHSTVIPAERSDAGTHAPWPRR